MMTQATRWLVRLALLTAMGAGVSAWADPGASGPVVTPVRVAYTSGDMVYIDAGEDDGLSPGTVVEIARAGRPIGSLRVLYVSARSASGAVVSGERGAEAGDEVLFTRRGTPAVVEPGSGGSTPASGANAATPAVRTAHRSRGWFRDRGVDGRIGIGTMSVGDHGAGSRQTLQQTLDLRVTGTNIGGSPVSMAIDVRTRQTEQTATGEITRDRQARVNLLSGSWRPAGGPFELSVGRQAVAYLGTIGVFDGALARYSHGPWQVGAISATRPTPATDGFSSDMREYGLYARFESARDAHGHVSLGTGVVGAYRGGQVDREYVALQQGYDDARSSAYFSEEIDVNRGWKRAAGEKTFAMTSFYSQLSHRLSNRTSVMAGFDNRRNTRLLEDRDVINGFFDDTYRDGAWLGASTRFRERFDARCDGRWSSLQGRDQNESYTFSFGAGRLWPFELALRPRTTWFRGPGGEGWLHGLSCDFTPTARTSLSLRGGTKQDPSVPGGSTFDRYLWYGLDFDVSVGRHWFMLLSGERRREAGETIEQILAKMTWRL